MRQSACHLMETKSLEIQMWLGLELETRQTISILKYQTKYSCRTIFGARPEECHGLKKSHVNKSIFLMRQSTCHLISNVRSSTHVAQFFAAAHNSKRVWIYDGCGLLKSWSIGVCQVFIVFSFSFFICSTVGSVLPVMYDTTWEV